MPFTPEDVAQLLANTSPDPSSDSSMYGAPPGADPTAPDLVARTSPAPETDNSMYGVQAAVPAVKANPRPKPAKPSKQVPIQSEIPKPISFVTEIQPAGDAGAKPINAMPNKAGTPEPDGANPRPINALPQRKDLSGDLKKAQEEDKIQGIADNAGRGFERAVNIGLRREIPSAIPTKRPSAIEAVLQQEDLARRQDTDIVNQFKYGREQVKANREDVAATRAEKLAAEAADPNSNYSKSAVASLESSGFGKKLLDRVRASTPGFQPSAAQISQILPEVKDLFHNDMEIAKAEDAKEARLGASKDANQRAKEALWMHHNEMETKLEAARIAAGQKRDDASYFGPGWELQPGAAPLSPAQKNDLHKRDSAYNLGIRHADELDKALSDGTPMTADKFNEVNQRFHDLLVNLPLTTGANRINAEELRHLEQVSGGDPTKFANLAMQFLHVRDPRAAVQRVKSMLRDDQETVMQGNGLQRKAVAPAPGQTNAQGMTKAEAMERVHQVAVNSGVSDADMPAAMAQGLKQLGF